MLTAASRKMVGDSSRESMVMMPLKTRSSSFYNIVVPEEHSPSPTFPGNTYPLVLSPRARMCVVDDDSRQHFQSMFYTNKKLLHSQSHSQVVSRSHSHLLEQAEAVEEVDSIASFSFSPSPSPVTLPVIVSTNSSGSSSVDEMIEEEEIVANQDETISTSAQATLLSQKTLSHSHSHSARELLKDFPREETKVHETLDVLFLLYETPQEQVHNRNQISCTRYLKDGFMDISHTTADEVEKMIERFLITDSSNPKMIVYVGHGRQYCHLDCGQDTFLSEETFFHVIEKYAQTNHLYLAFLCCSLEFYREDRTNHKELLASLSTCLLDKQQQQKQDVSAPDTTAPASVKVNVLWDRTKQRYPTSFLGRREFHVYGKIEDEIARYHEVRFYEE